MSKNQVTREEVEAVPIPESTRSHRPVPYGDVIDLLFEKTDSLGLELQSEQYGLNQNGDQMFAVLTYFVDSDENGLSIGLRQSYNKTIALGGVAGSKVFVCDNLMFQGSAFKVVRRNTLNVWHDFVDMLEWQIKNCFKHYEAITADADEMKGLPCDTERGYELIGRAWGENVLTPTQASVVLEEWKNPSYEELNQDNLWGLYNAFTHGLKKGPPARIPERHAKAHDFFRPMIEA